MYYDPLIAKWATLTGTTEEKLTQINTLTITGPMRDVPAVEVRNYLLVNGITYKLRKFIAAPGAAADEIIGVAQSLLDMVSLPDASPFIITDPTLAAQFSGFLDALISVNIISDTDKTNLLVLSETVLLWCTAPVELGGGGLSSSVSYSDLTAAGGLV